MTPNDIPIDRRSFLVGAASACVACFDTAVAATPAYRLQVGDIEATVLSDGHLQLPIQVIAASEARERLEGVLAAAGLPTHEVRSPTNVTLVRTGQDLVLIDAGAGANFVATAGKLTENLEAAGFDRGAITKVLITHAHPDHLWGVIDDLDDEPRFPKAKHYIAAAEWDFWTDSGALAQMPEERRGFVLGAQRVLKSMGEKIARIRPGDDIAPGLRLIDTSGHTPGHLSVEISSGRDTLLVLADALTHAVISFQHPDWKPFNDQQPERAIAMRKRLLDRLSADRTRFVAYHLPYPGVGYAERKDGAYRFLPAA